MNMPKAKKRELSQDDYADYGEYLAAKKAAEAAKPKAEAEEVEAEEEK